MAHVADLPPRAKRRILALLLGAAALAPSLGAPAGAVTLDLFAGGEEVAVVGGRASQTIYREEDPERIDDFDPGTPDGTKVGILRLDSGKPFPPGLRDPLISAAAEDDGAYGAGVSAGYLDPGYLSADAGLTYTFRNDGPVAETYEQEFRIPAQSVGLSGYPSSHEDLQASSRIQILASTLDSRGVPTGDLLVRALSIELRKVPDPFNWTTEFFFSDDLVSALDTLDLDSVHKKYYDKLPVGSSWVSTVSIPAYSIRLESSPIQPGESLILDLYASADVNVGPFGAEQGAEAFAGDPFNLMRSPGPVLDIDLGGGVTPAPTPAAVPLPAPAYLLIGALALLGGIRRRRKGAAKRRPRDGLMRWILHPPDHQRPAAIASCPDGRIS